MSPEIWNPEFKVTCANVTFELWKGLSCKRVSLENFKTVLARAIQNRVFQSYYKIRMTRSPT